MIEVPPDNDGPPVSGGVLIARRASLPDAPLSFAQEQLWFIDEFHNGLAAHNVANLIRLRGPLDPAALDRAVNMLRTRHEALRTRLVASADGRPAQVIDPPPTSPSPHTVLELADFSESGPQAAAGRLAEFAAAQAVQVFHLAADWPLRAHLVRLTAREHALLLVAHRTAVDDCSFELLTRDLAALYGAEVSGGPAALEQPPARFADYAVRERERLRGGVLAGLQDYWREVLTGQETSQFPADRPRPVLASHDGAVAGLAVGGGLLAGLRELSERAGTTLSVTLLAGLQALLSRHTGQTDVVIGLVGAGQGGRPELPEPAGPAGLVGPVADMLPVRADLSADPAFSELLARVHAAFRGATAHRGLPFAQVVEALEIERDPGRFPVFQVGFGCAEPAAQIASSGLVFNRERVPVRAAMLDISFLAEPRGDELWLEATYTPALFDAGTVRRLLGNWEVLLRGALSDPASRLSGLPVLTADELRDELETWNDTAAAFPVLCVHEVFEAQAARSPGAAAARFDDQRWTYAQLNERANQVARWLRELGAGPEVLVGVCMRTGLERLACLLGVWKAGGGYVPLDPDLPADRLSFMIADTGMPVVLADEASADRVPEAGQVTVVRMDAERARLSGLDGSDLPATGLAGTGVTPSNVAYVIYTSGSTGAPKGVVVEHRQVVNFLQGMAGPWGIGPGSVVLQFAAFTFDVSVSDMFLPLLHGGSVVLAGPETLHSPPRLAELIRAAGVTFACLPPAVLNLLTGEDFPGLRTLLSAGSELSSELLRSWLRDGLDIFNGYGPTEASIGATFMRLDAGTPLPPPIGRPKPNYRVYVLDRYLNPVPVGVIGELHIGGAGVARGYLNRPELTRERFIPDPFSAVAGARLYKTGDLVRRRADGTIVFAGRADDQVKIRGLRVELGEIEAALVAHPEVAQAVVTVVTDPAGEPQLAGYLRARQGCQPELAELRAHLAGALPAYMIPTYLTVVEQFPLTTNGKIDKSALPRPQSGAAGGGRMQPQTIIEMILTDMYATVLGTEQVGATDSFFDAGGNSLQAMRLITQLRTALAVDLDVSSVFLAPTPQQLAALLRDKHGFEDAEIGEADIDGLLETPGHQVDPDLMSADEQRTALTTRLRGDRESGASEIQQRPAGLTDLPLSYGQEQLWFIDQFAPGQPTYNVPLALRLTGPLDPGALGRAIDGLVARHEALRTRLVTGPGGRPIQVIDPPRSAQLDLADLSAQQPAQAQATLREFIDVEAVRPFALADGRLLRTSLLRLAATEHVLLVVVHHTVFDGWSSGVLARELPALYRSAVTGEPSGLAELPVQFADYALWERSRLQGPVLAELDGYWQDVLDGFETLQFPTDRPHPVLENFEGGLAVHMTGRPLLDGLRELSRREGTTLFVTLMTALHALLSRYTGQTDLVVGTVSASRANAELAPLIGFLVNTFPIRADLSGDPAFTDLLAQVRETTLGAYTHQDLPFARLVEALHLDRDPSRAPVFQVALSYADRDEAPVTAAGVEFVLTDLVVGINAAKFDLDFLAEARGDGLWIECSYKTALFDAATVRRLLANFEVLLQGVVGNPAARLSRLPLLTAAELHRELAEWNDTAAGFPMACLHRAFEAQAARTPDAVAVEFERETLPYAELNGHANRIARRLRERGVGPETLVGVCMRAGPRRVAAVLAILKAGGGYVPLDPALPASRLSFLLADTGMPLMLADDSAAAAIAETGATVLRIDADWAAISGLDGANLDDGGPAGPASHAVSPRNVAYVIYTSGSTGQPKGVIVEHRQAMSCVQAMNRQWQLGPASAMLQFASFTFDVSMTDMFMPLLSGGRLVLASTETLHSPQRLAALIRAARITYVDLPVAVLSLLTSEQFPDLQVLMTGGEELPSELARRWVRPGLRLVNGYGPTETTVTATCQELDTSMSPPPIGRPIAGYRGYVLDRQLSPVPAGVVGELYIGGAGVARGYLNQPGLTAAQFIPDPFGGEAGARLYKSGDLVRRRPDGSIVFVGRVDGQVKIRGLRVEPGEIEAALDAHPAVAQAVVSVATDPAGERQLVGYVRLEPGTEPGTASPADLRSHLARTLPAYLVPGYLVVVTEFGLNASGKIDRSALPAPRWQQRDATGDEEPEPALVAALTRLYAAVLGRERVAADDGFFDIGGSSLQVMRLVDKISKELAVDVGVSAIFLHSSPRQLAGCIEAIQAGAELSSGAGPLVELSGGAGQQPLFLIHAVGGTVFAYAQLASELAGKFQVQGIQAPGLGQGGVTAASLAGLVADYTERIRAAQPDGPYHLGGWSMGGVVAFEIARRLEQAGERVGLLVLLDAPFALPDTGVPAQPALAGRFLADATRSLGWDTDGQPDPATSSAAEQLAWLAGRLAAGDGPGVADAADRDRDAADRDRDAADRDRDPADCDRDPADCDRDRDAADRDRDAADAADAADRDRDAVAAQLRRRFEVFQAHVRMLAGYRPAAPAVRARTLIVSADDSPNARFLTRWPEMLGGPVQTMRIAGDHYQFLRYPLVSEVAAAILDWQGEAR